MTLFCRPYFRPRSPPPDESSTSVEVLRFDDSKSDDFNNDSCDSHYQSHNSQSVRRMSRGQQRHDGAISSETTAMLCDDDVSCSAGDAVDATSLLRESSSLQLDCARSQFAASAVDFLSSSQAHSSSSLVTSMSGCTSVAGGSGDAASSPYCDSTPLTPSSRTASPAVFKNGPFQGWLETVMIILQMVVVK